MLFENHRRVFTIEVNEVQRWSFTLTHSIDPCYLFSYSKECRCETIWKELIYFLGNPVAHFAWMFSRSFSARNWGPFKSRINSNVSVFLQDTVVALQALALYSEKTAGNALDLKVKLTFGDARPIAVHITPENALLRKKFEVRIHFTSGISSTLHVCHL